MFSGQSCLGMLYKAQEDSLPSVDHTLNSTTLNCSSQTEKSAVEQRGCHLLVECVKWYLCNHIIGCHNKYIGYGLFVCVNVCMYI